MGFLQRKLAESLDLKLRRLYMQRMKEMASLYGTPMHPHGPPTAVHFHRAAFRFAREGADPRRALAASAEGPEQLDRMEATLLAETAHALNLEPGTVLDEYERTAPR